MTFLVPAVLGALAVAVVAVYSVAASRRGRQRAAGAVSHARILVHAINDDRCTGCDACVAVCPTKVLDLVGNKSRVARFQDCIQCEACMWACPTEALVMHPEGAHPPPFKAPDLDDFYQTNVPGQYLIGEVAGKPLVKNAANLGRVVVEHMLATGLRPSGGSVDLLDVVIVGSGPAGLSAALTCHHHGLSYTVLEKENFLASTVARYPRGKAFMAEPYDCANRSFLPVYDCSKEELLSVWQELVDRVGLSIRSHEAVQSVSRHSDGTFRVATQGAVVRARRVVLATGTRGKPRTLGVAGEELAKVSSFLEDPRRHRGQAVCVVGGGDSALEAAVALADSGARVILTYRGRAFQRACQRNRKTIERYVRERRIKVKLMSQVVEFGADTVTLQMSDGVQKRYPNHASFVLIGADPPIEWLSRLGVRYTQRPHMQPMAASDALVSRFLGSATSAAPETAEQAMAMVLGREVPAAAREAGQRSARGSNHPIAAGGLEEGPLPLSEFARRSRRGEGAAKRDQLDASERTRILRMLRDVGGLRADEDSQIQLLPDADVHSIDDSSDFDSEPSAMGSPAPTSRDPSSGEWAGTTITGDAPRPAVIVGLAKAAARGPRNGRRRRRSHSRDRIAARSPVPPLIDERTEQLTAAEAERLVCHAMTPQPERDLRDTAERHDEATNLVAFDAAEFMLAHGGARDTQRIPPLADTVTGPHLVDEATDMMTPEQLFGDVAGLADTAGAEPLHAEQPLYPEEPRRVRQAVAGSRSLSEIDFDLE